MSTTQTSSADPVLTPEEFLDLVQRRNRLAGNTFPDNAPPYVAYGLLRPAEGFAVLRRLDTTALDSLLIGTDGAADLAALAGARVPGTDEPVGPLARWWQDDRFFRNPDAVRRRLALLNSPGWRRDSAGRLAPEPPLLRDDTTLVALRRRRC